MTPRSSSVGLAIASFILATLALLVPLHARAQIPAGRMTAPNGYAKDFAVVKRAGLFHVFYIESGPGGDFNYLGHQTSPDLYHWTVRPNVLVADRSDWNPDFVWAPSIVEQGGKYWMFYTGVRQRAPTSCPGAPIQQIGVATSTDLEDWTLEPESWLDPTEAPWSLPPSDSCQYASFGAFRDPCVVWDPTTNQWVMLYVTIPDPDSTATNVPHPGAYDPDRMVVGEARAPATFGSDADWVDLHALWITHAAYPNGTGMKTWESPHAFSRLWQGQPLWFLFASTGTTTTVEGVSFMTGPSLTLSQFAKKGRSGWTWRGSIANLQIHDQYGKPNLSFDWFATEYFRDPDYGLEYFANVSVPYLEFRQLKWRTTSYGFDLEQPFAVKGILTRPLSVTAGQPVDVNLESMNALDGGGPKFAHLEAVTVDVDGVPTGVAPPGTLGLPDSVAITGDETHVSWMAPKPDVSSLLLRVRLAPPSSDVMSEVVTIYGSGAPKLDHPSGGGQDTSVRPTLAEGDQPFLVALGSPGVHPRLSFNLTDRSAARLTLIDLRGRRVRRLLDRDLPRGAYDVAWDGCDDRGARLPSGIYFARLEAASAARVTRVVLIGR